MPPEVDPSSLPSALLTRSEWTRLGDDVPVMIVRPKDSRGGHLVPLVIWMHGRTAFKELDPGRYLRLMRSGIAVCAIDLPGHGERMDPDLHEANRTLDVILRMEEEIDAIVHDLRAMGTFDPDRTALGGMSAGGMAALARLCRPHGFAAAAVEATTGAWEAQRHRAMFEGVDPAFVRQWNPIERLSGWRDIPLQAIHARKDEWIGIDGQTQFIEALRAQYGDADRIEFIVYEETGAPYEHIGFGRKSADAKEQQRRFLTKWLHPG